MTIKVVILEPGKKAYISEISNTLNGMQSAVGGLIEPIYPFDDDVCIICNEEGKMNGMPLNRAIYSDSGEIIDIIAGKAFICNCSKEHFSSLTSEQLSKYKALFEHPEIFARINGRIIAIKFNPCDRSC